MLAVLVALVGVAVTVVGLALAVREGLGWRETTRVQRGPRVLAVIVSTGHVRGRYQGVRLRYADRDGRPHEISVRYPLGVAKDVIVGMSTSVVYDPRHPGQAELAGHPRHSWQDAVIVAALTAAATGGWLRWVLMLLLAARREDEAPSIRLGPPGSVERRPAPRPARAHAFGSLAAVSLLLLLGGKLVAQLVTIDRPQVVAFPPLPVLPESHGRAVVPAVLTAAAPRSGPLITPQSAQAVVAAAWRFRDDALARHDVAAVRAIDTGPALTVDVANLKAGVAPNRPEPTADDLHQLTAFTPRQTQWPLRLLAEAVSTTAGAPGLEMMVLTRRGPRDGWHVALDTFVGSSDRYKPAIDSQIRDADGYDVVPHIFWIDPHDVVDAAARYWQSLRETGSPPADGVAFADGYWTTGYGKTIAGSQDRRDARNGLRAHMVYGDPPTPRDDVWTFGAYRNWMLVCAPMYEEKTWSGRAHQDRDRQKWGGDLAPGVYRSITGEFVRETCYYVPPIPFPPGIVIVGADPWGIATRGERAA